MAEPKKAVCDPEFWKYRLHWAAALGRGTHVAIYDIDPHTWNDIQNVTKRILSGHARKHERLLDVGCGIGTLSSYLPNDVLYTGIDISPDMVAVARLAYPQRRFEVQDARNLPTEWGQNFDWAVCRSIRKMIVDNLGQVEWDQMQREILRVAKQLILIEYENPTQYEILG